MSVSGGDEEEGGHESNLKSKVAFPENYVLPHNEEAMILDMTPENAADVCPHISEIMHAAHPEIHSQGDMASSSGTSSH